MIITNDFNATHLPFVVQQENNQWVLVSHMALVNSQTDGLDGTEVLIIFNGPHAYIPSRVYEKGPAAPTWNYATVHVRGRVQLLDSQRALLHRDL